MSVANLRSSFEKKGCRIALWVLMVGAALAIAGTGIMCLPDQSGQSRNPALDIELLKVNGQSISLAAVYAATDDRRLNYAIANQLLAFGGLSEADLEFEAMASALRALVRASVEGSLARSRGVTVDDSTAIAMFGQQIDQEIFSIRLKGITDGDLPQVPTEQEFQDYFLRERGQSASDVKQQLVDNFRTQLADPDRREALLAPFLENALLLSFYSTTVVTEDEVRRSFETLSLKVISFDDFETSIDDRRAEAEKALAELVGGAAFDSVMRKYMDEPVTEPVDIRRTALEIDEQLQPLNDLEPGEDSDVVLAFGTVPSIYRLVEVKSDLPEDLEDNMDVYSDQLRADKSRPALEQAISDGVASATIEWSSPGYEAIYTLAAAPANSDLSEEEVEAYIRQVVDTTFLLNEDPAGSIPATLARYVAMERLLDRLSEDERREMLEARAEVILDVLVSTESVGLRLTLVDLYGEMEEWEAQAAALLTAAEMNRGIDPINEIYFSQINEKLKLMEDAEQIDEATAGKIHQELLAWSEDMADANNDDAAATAIDLEKFNIDPEPDFLIGSGDDDGGTEADDEDEDDSEQSGGGDG